MNCGGDLPHGWWRNADLLRQERLAHSSLSQAARFHGIDRTTLHKWWRKLGLGRLEPTPVRTPAVDESDEWLLKALKKLGDNASVEQLADFCEVPPRRVRETRERLGLSGYRVTEEDDRVSIVRVPVPSKTRHKVLFKGDTYRFGIASDAHLNSRHCRLDELHMAYDRFESEGITTVYNPGDIVAGRGIFRGQDHEIVNHTFETQREYAVENYPRRKGVVTRIISGNHDCEGDFGKAGADVCLGVANERDDIEWGGRYAADYELPNGAVMTMRHPMGGSSYAKSYKPQKFAESYEGGTKPGVVLFGHWHNAEWGFHRNIHMLNCGTFEGYGGSLGLRVPLGAPAVGFYIVDMVIGDDASVVRFRPEFFPFFAGRQVKVAA